MHCLDLTLPTPAENLACDETLLDRCESGKGPEILRFWEPAEYFVVLGYANRLATEVNVPACLAGQVPILRRSSGGGTVLQGPGCLNYTLILRIGNHESLGTITAANRFIMERNRAALDSLARNFAAHSGPGDPPAVRIRGHTDLAVADRKFSGNAQRRKRAALLFHGTFLLQFDLSQIERFLPPPSQQPAYRENRSHRDFLANFPAPAAAVKRALQEAWGAQEPLENVPRETIRLLARDKYMTPEWNQKF